METNTTEEKEVIVAQAVNIVTIKELKTLYKNGEPANAIELALCEEHSFDIVVQKGLYTIGSKAVYVQPDYCLPLLNETDEPNSLAQNLFSDFTYPNNGEQKTKLGKHGRIRAIKFNFQVENSSDPIYSMGIMLPLTLVYDLMKIESLDGIDNLDEFFQVTKYEEPETGHSGLCKGPLPSGMYKTDETNIKNVTRTEYPVTLTGGLKVDGSSITLYYKNDQEKGICSRQLEKKLEQKMVSHYTDENGNNVRRHYDLESRTKGWMNEGTNEFLTTIPETYGVVEKEMQDSFVDLGLPVLNKLEQYCKDNNRQLVLRGELCGTGLKGSGNALNPHAKMKQQILFYGIDDYSSGVTKKVSLTEFYTITSELGLSVCDVIFKDKVFNTYDEIKEACEAYFKDNVVEGIVLRNESCSFSVKYMNNYYDSRK